jgi:hypothetical protein
MGLLAIDRVTHREFVFEFSSTGNKGVKEKGFENVENACYTWV